MDAIEVYIYNHHPPLEALWFLRHITDFPVFLTISSYLPSRALLSCPINSSVFRIVLSAMLFHMRYFH